MNDTNLSTQIIKVGSLLQYNNLAIPVYQRPYKWNTKHVNQLLEDIISHKDKSAYRLGTIIFHKDENGKINIVDGQQRTITLSLIANAILKLKIKDIINPDLKKYLIELGKNIINPKFISDISIINLQNNYREIERFVAGFDDDIINFLFYKCEFIQFIITDISEAFQFFDSQNARGKDLEPHDLLKAYHLREFSKSDESLKFKEVETWESMQSDELSYLFGEYLFRIKGWSKGYSSRYFTKEEVDLFKGINIDKIGDYPFTEIIRITHYFIDSYNNNYERKIDNKVKGYPFQLDQVIINGRRFFQMISHYKNVLKNLFVSISSEKLNLNGIVREILNTIDSYEGKNRIGDIYVRTLFDCAIIHYNDKFGMKYISKAIEKAFIWAYSLRLNYEAVQFASVDNYVLKESNYFKSIRDANHPNDILTMYLKPIERIKSTKTDSIVNLFKKLKYYEEQNG